jgi:serine/threonine-protein kinase
MEQAGFQIGAYSVLSRLGIGGMGEVWLATREGRRCVVKTLLPHLADDERIREMFLKEGRVASMISDPSVVQIYELGSVGGQYFMALEYVEGASLDRLLGARRKLSALVTAYIASRACAGLQAIHEHARAAQGGAMRIVHRDISPSNLLLSMGGEVKVADFGIAKTSTTDPGGTTTHGTTKGKIAYMSPEQARGQSVDQRTDLFALGVVMYEAMAGDLPYARSKNDFEMLSQVVYGRRTPLATLLPDAPAPLAEVIERAMNLDPEQRWPSARQMRSQIDAWLDRQSHGAQRARDELGALVRGMRVAPSLAVPVGRAQTKAVDAHARTVLSRPMEGAPVPPLQVTPKMVPAGPSTEAASPLPSPPRRRFRPKRSIGAAALATLAIVCVTWLVTQERASEPVLPVVIDAPPPAPLPPELAVVPTVIHEQEVHPGVTPLGPVAPHPKVRTPPHVPSPSPPSPPPPSPPALPVPPPEKALTFDAQPGVDVYAGQRLLGHTPLQVSMAGESAQLRLVSAADGIDYDYELQGDSPQQLKVPQATLHVRVDPWAEVTLDGRPLGMTPVAPMTVFAGRHVIVLVNDDRKVRRQVDVMLAPNETKVVREKL